MNYVLCLRWLIVDSNKEALQEIIRAVEYLVEQKLQQNTQIFDGILLPTGQVRINGKDYFIKHYGNFSHESNSVVKVFVPQGNMNISFYI